jgi:hypothetical protein
MLSLCPMNRCATVTFRPVFRIWDPGSGAFFDLFFWIQDPGWLKSQDPDPG